MAIPTPEQLQYILGIHPDQQAAAIAAAQQDSSNLQPDGEPRPLPNGDKYDRQPVTQPPLLRAGPTPRGLDIPKVGEGEPAPESPTPVVGTVPPAPKPTSAAPDQQAMGAGSTEMAAGTKTIGDLMTKPIDPYRTDEENQRAELNRLQTTGSGISQFSKRHHILGPILRGLDIAGQVLAPGVSEAIPGTELHHRELMGEAQGRIGKDIEAEKAHSQMATAEEGQRAREEANRIREEGMQDKINQANQKFVAGTEKEDPNSPTGYTAQTIGGDWKPFTPPASYKPTKGETFEDIQRRREAEADRQGLTGKDRKFYIANGKLSEPGVHISNPSAALEELHDWEAAFEREHGRKPNAQEISDFKHGGKGATYAKDRETFESHWAKRLGPGSAVEKKYDSQRQAVLKSYGADKDPDIYKTNKADIDAKFAEIEANREAEKASLQQEKDEEAEQYGVYERRGAPQPVPHGAPATTGATAKPVPPAAQPAQAIPKPPQPGTKLDPTNEEHKKIALAYVKAAGGNKVKARALAKRDGWSF